MTIVEVLREPAVGSLLGFVGIVAAAYFYANSNKKKKLVFVNKESVILGDASDALSGKLHVLFDGKEVARVTRSVFVVWNAGRETIRGVDIASGDMLRIEFPAGTTILSADIDRLTRPAIGAQLIRDAAPNEESHVRLSFDFLDFNDGVNLSIVHNAATGSGVVRGTLVGMPAGPKNRGPAEVDIEAYRTPKPSERRYKRIAFRLVRLVFRALLLVLPPIVVLGACFTDLVIAFLPSMGTPDTTAMLVVGKVNVLWLCVGSFFLILEVLYLFFVFHRPPKTLTG